MGYYERVAMRELANEFYAELRHYMQQAAVKPKSSNAFSFNHATVWLRAL